MKKIYGGEGQMHPLYQNINNDLEQQNTNHCENERARIIILEDNIVNLKKRIEILENTNLKSKEYYENTVDKLNKTIDSLNTEILLKNKNYNELKSKYDKIINKHRKDAFLKTSNLPISINRGGKKRTKKNIIKRR